MADESLRTRRDRRAAKARARAAEAAAAAEDRHPGLFVVHAIGPRVIIRKRRPRTPVR